MTDTERKRLEAEVKLLRKENAQLQAVKIFDAIDSISDAPIEEARAEITMTLDGYLTESQINSLRDRMRTVERDGSFLRLRDVTVKQTAPQYDVFGPHR